MGLILRLVDGWVGLVQGRVVANIHGLRLVVGWQVVDWVYWRRLDSQGVTPLIPEWPSVLV